MANALHADSRSNLVGLWLQTMADTGSSVALTWGEDTGAWECSWITDGVRYTALGDSPAGAVSGAYVVWSQRGDGDEH